MSRKDAFLFALLLLAAACLAPRPAFAIGGNSVVTANGPAVVHTTANSATVVYGGNATNSASLARAYGLQGAGASVADTVAVRAAGQQVAVTATRAVTAEALAAGAARVALNPVVGGVVLCITVCPALADLLTASQLRGTPAGGLEQGVGGSYQVGRAFLFSGKYFANPQAACQSQLVGGYANLHCGNFKSQQVGYWEWQLLNAQEQYINRGGGSYVYRDSCFDATGKEVAKTTAGLCPEATWTAANMPAAISRIQANLSPDKMADVARDVVSNGGQPEAGPVTVSGPASSTPRTVTQTGPNGTTTTNITNNYTYQGDTITWNETTTVNAPGGDTTTTTGPAPDTSSECEKNPDSLGCMRPGDLPTDKPQWQSRNVVFAVDELGLPSACPAPRQMVWRGTTLTLNYQPACDVAPMVKAALIIITAISCTLIVVQVIRS